jgi:IS5 family transposase
MRPGKRRQLPAGGIEAQTERLKAQVRAKVEYPFRYIKRVFGHDKVRYRGLGKNGERLHMLVAFINLMVGKKYLLT